MLLGDVGIFGDCWSASSFGCYDARRRLRCARPVTSNSEVWQDDFFYWALGAVGVVGETVFGYSIYNL